jgi:hypothetical protein
VLHDSKPEYFRAHLRTLLRQIDRKPPEHRLLFIKSWNEWAEGNHLEPDLKFGRAYLEVLQQELANASASRPPQANDAPALLSEPAVFAP